MGDDVESWRAPPALVVNAIVEEVDVDKAIIVLGLCVLSGLLQLNCSRCSPANIYI